MLLPKSKGNLRLYPRKQSLCSPGRPHLELHLQFWETLEEGHGETRAHLEDVNRDGERIGNHSNAEWLEMLGLLGLGKGSLRDT